MCWVVYVLKPVHTAGVRSGKRRQKGRQLYNYSRYNNKALLSSPLLTPAV